MEKPGPHKTACLILDLLFGTVFQKFRRKSRIRILSNIRWNATIAMISLIQIYEILVDLIMFYLSFPASLWLKDHNENKAIRLFCFILATLFFVSLILLLTSTFFACCQSFLWVGYLIFSVSSFSSLLHSGLMTKMKIRLFACFVLSFPYYFSSH